MRREEFLKSGGFDCGLKYAMDYDLWLRLSKISPAKELHVPLTAFREHDGSLSTSNRQAAMQEDYQIRLSHCADNPVALLEHRLRYWMRRRRLAKFLAAQVSTG